MPSRSPTVSHLPLPTGFQFHDNPLGKLHGKSRATAQAAQAPRTGWKKVAHGLRHGWGRFLNAATPSGVRADPKYRNALKDTSRTVGDLLGLLISPQGNLASSALNKAFTKIEDTAGPVTQRGVAFKDLLAQRFEVHLAQLTPAELKTLRTQLTVLQASGTAPEVKPHLDSLSQKLAKEVERRVLADCRTQLLPRLKEAIAEAGQGSPRAPDTYQSLSGMVKSTMSKYGMSHAAKYADETQLALSVLGVAINGLLERGDVSASEFKTLLNALPSSDQASLQAATSEHWSARSSDALDLLVADVALQGQRGLAERFQAAAQGALSSLSQPDQVDAQGLRCLIEAAEQWKALARHHSAHGLDIDPQLVRAFNAIADRLPQLVLHQASLDALGVGELPALSKALTSFDNTEGVPTIALAIEERLARGIRRCHEAMLPTLDQLGQGDVRASLKALVAMQDVLTGAKTQQEQLKGLNQTGADDVRNFEYGVYEPFFTDMGADQRTTYIETLASPATQQLVETLRGVGADLWNASGGDENDPRHATAEQLLGIGQTLMQLLDSANRAHAASTGDEAPAEPELDPSRQDPEIREAVSEVFQIPLS